MSSEIHIPPLSKENTQAALIGLAHAKFIKDRVATAEKAYKGYLHTEAMEPGSKMTAYVDGMELATISRSKVTAGEPKLTVIDERRLVAWLHTHEPVWYEANIQPRLPEWVGERELETFIEHNDGELPPGVEVIETASKGGALTVRMTPAQEDNYTRLFTRMVEATKLITDGGEEQ